MAAGIEIYNYVTNQKGSPAIYSDTLANRPAAGFIGRLFVSTDTLEIYRDNGINWDLITGGGGGVNIYNSNGTLTGTRTMTMANNDLTFDGGANPARLIMSANNNITRSFSFATAGATRWAFTVDDNETGTNTGGNWYLRAYTDAGVFLFDPISVERATGEKSMIAIETLDNGSDTLTGVYNITGGTYLAGLTMIGGNPHGASHNNYTLANAGNLTFANSIYLGAQSNVLRLQANNSGTITLSAASPGIRTAAATLNQIQYNTTTGAAITYTHASIMQTLGIYRLAAAGSLTVTNAYGLIVNDLNEYGYAATGGGALVLTNRWGIYQDSTTDINYFGGNTLLGNNVNTGEKLQITGNAKITGTLAFGTQPVITEDVKCFINYTSSASVARGFQSYINYSGNYGATSFDAVVNVNSSTNYDHIAVYQGVYNISGSAVASTGVHAYVAEGIFNGTSVQPLATLLKLGNISGTGTITNKYAIYQTSNLKSWLGNNLFDNGKIYINGSSTSTATWALTINASANTLIEYQLSGSQFCYTGLASAMFSGGSNGFAIAVNGTNPIIFGAGGTRYMTLQSGTTFIATTTSVGDYSLQNGNAIYTANNALGIAIATQNNRFIAGEYGIGVGTATFDASQTNGINVRSGTAPTTNVADVFVMYAADITAGNAAPHFRTENGNTVKIYQETTGVGSATFASPGAGSTVKTDDTFDGYTLQQVVKALRNLGILA